MEYRVKINFADSFDVYDTEDEGLPFVSNVKLKDSTSLENNITLGTAVSKQLTFSLYNAPVEIFDGEQVTLFIDTKDEGDTPIDLTAYELTDEEVLNDLFVVPEIPDGGNEFDAEDLTAIADDIEAEGTEYEYDISTDLDVSEGEEELTDNPENEVYREEVSEGTEDVAEPEEPDDWIELGTFYVTDIKNNNGVYNIVALDGFILMNGKYVPTNNVDTVENMYADFIAQMEDTLGLAVNYEPTYPNLTIIWDYDTTYREAAGYFAGLLGGYATFDRSGALDIRQYMKTEIPIDDPISIQLNNDGTVYIMGMRCDKDITALENWVSTSAEINGYSIDFVNPFMTSSILNDIFTTYYQYLEYTPAKLTLDWYANIQAGDLIFVNETWILITNQTIDFASGTTTIDSLGTTATLSEGQITDPMVRKIQRTQSNLKNSVQVAQELAQEADLMATATNQHFWSTTDGIYYLSEDTTVDTSKKYFSKSGDTYTRVTPTGTENPVTEGWYERLGAGAYVTEVSQDKFNDPESTNYHSGKNSLWNSAGMLFRNGLRRLLAIVTEDVNGVAVYDGLGNSANNIIALFTGNRLAYQDQGVPVFEVESSQLVHSINQKFTSRKKTTEDNDWADYGEYRQWNITSVPQYLYEPDLTIPVQVVVAYSWTIPVSGTPSDSGEVIVSLSDYNWGHYTWTYNDEPIVELTLHTTTNGLSINYFRVPISALEGGLYFELQLKSVIYSTNAVSSSRVYAGAYPDKNEDNLFTIGNGTSSSNTSNAFTVDWQGITTIGGDANVGGGVSSLANTGTTGATYRITQKGSNFSTSYTGDNLYGTISHTHKLVGYFPIALAHYRFGYNSNTTHATLQNVYRAELSSVASGEAVVSVGRRDMASSGSGTCSLQTTVLWAKESGAISSSSSRSSGSGGTANYNELTNKPQIEGITLTGNNSFEDLSLEKLTNTEIENLLSEE